MGLMKASSPARLKGGSMTFDISKLKFSTKGCVGFLLGIGSLLQIPQVSAPVFAFIKLHPHYATAFAMLTGVITLLHNPQVEAVLGINIPAQQLKIDVPAQQVQVPENPALKVTP
jgi:hypothetical protein